MGKFSYAVNGRQLSTVSSAALNENQECSKFRRILPQVLASTAKNFLLLDLGMSVAFPTIVIPALRGLKNRDEAEFLTLTDVQASWFASVAYICQPLGSIMSGIINDPLGRKKSMILVNIPHIIAWSMMYFASSLTELFIAATLLGLGVGFMEAPILTYVGEITEPSIRGIMTAAAGIAATLGFSTVFFLGTQTTWRVAAAICCVIPIATCIAICFVPETPYWLLSKGRENDARKSLQWLRGWVSAKGVEKEFQEMKRYSENANKCTPCQKSNVVACSHRPPFMERTKELMRKRTLKPFFLVLAFFAFTQFSGMHGMRPYLVQIFETFRFPVDSNWGTVIIGLMGLLANIIATITVKFIGKRRLALFSMAGTCTCCLALAFYAYKVLPPGWTSFDTYSEESLQNVGDLSYVPLCLFIAMAFSTSVGIMPVPWMLVSEIFPYKTRGTASGLVAALNYVMSFISTKTYLNLEKSLSLYGTILLYGCIGVIGFFFIYFFIPETERRTLEDIEIHFSDNNRKMTDRKIRKNCSFDDFLNAQTKKETKKNGCDNKAYETNEHDKR